MDVLGRPHRTVFVIVMVMEMVIVIVIVMYTSLVMNGITRYECDYSMSLVLNPLRLPPATSVVHQCLGGDGILLRMD